MTGPAEATGTGRSSVLALPARRPIATLAMTALFVVISLLGVSRIHPTASIESMLGDGNAAAGALKNVLDRFQTADEMLVLVRLPADAPGGEAGAARLLAYAQRFEKEVLASAGEWCEKVSYRAEPQVMEFVTQEMVPAGLWYLDDEAFDAVRRRLTREQMSAQIRQNEAMLASPGPAAEALGKVLIQDPLRLREFLLERVAGLRGTLKTWRGGTDFISEEGRSLLIRITGKLPPNDLDFAQAMTDAVRNGAERAGPEGLRVDLAGSYAIAAYSAQKIRSDIKNSVIQAVILLQLLFLVFYRNPLSFAVIFAPVAVGTLGAFGLHGVISRDLSPLTGAVGAMLAGLGIDYGIHYLSHVEDERAHGMTLVAAADLTVRRIAGPMTVACASAVAAFAVLCVSRMSSLRDFALVGAVGLALVMVASLIVIPAMLALIPDTLWGARLAGPRIRMAPMATWVARHRGLSAGTMLALILACFAVLLLMPGPAVAFEKDLRVMHPQPNPPLDTQADIGRTFGGGSESLLVYLESAPEQVVVERAYDVARALQIPSARDSGVAASFGLDLFLPDPRSINDRARKIRELDAERIVADFEAVFDESSFDPRPFDGYKTFLRTLVTTQRPPGLETLRRFPALASLFLGRGATEHGTDAVTTIFLSRPLDTSDAREHAVTTLRAAITGTAGATLTGLPVLGFDAEQTVRADLTKAVLVGAPLVLVLLLIYFKRVADIPMVVLPAIFSVLCLLAFMKLRGDSFNMANMAGVPLMIGLGVDCGIFLASISRQCRAERQPVAELVRRQGGAAHAMFMTSAPNVLGLLSLTTTATPAINSLGWALGLGVAACWAGSIFLLSPWLVWAYERWARKNGLA